MSRDLDVTTRHAFWRAAYRALLVLLPRTLREKHGGAMAELYARELERTEAHGQGTSWRVALSGLADLVGRGAYERVVEERAALNGPNVQVLRQLATAFVAALVALTTVMLATSVWRQQLRLGVHELTIGSALETSIFSIPFIAALTIPMSVFVAVLCTGTRAAADGAERLRQPGAHERSGRLRLAPLIGIASVVALFGLAWNAEVVPRANARLSSLSAGKHVLAPNDRSMTLNELRMASRQVAQQRAANPTAALRQTATGYSIEIHKKFAIAAACVALALLAAGIARRVPHAGLAVQLLASLVVFTGYYVALMTGESLADRNVVSPAVAMWNANALALGLALLALRQRGFHADATLHYGRSFFSR